MFAFGYNFWASFPVMVSSSTPYNLAPSAISEEDYGDALNSNNISQKNIKITNAALIQNTFGNNSRQNLNNNINVNSNFINNQNFLDIINNK